MSTDTDVTEVTPPTGEGRETDTRTYRVLRRDEQNPSLWHEEETLDSRYTPDATEVGEKYGEGDYLLIELDSRYSFHSTYPMTVVAEKRYREVES